MRPRCATSTNRSLSTAPPIRKARVAVVGCGGWTQGWHLPNLAQRDGVEIVALVDPSEQPGVGGCVPGACEPMTILAHKYGAKRYESFESLLAETSAGDGGEGGGGIGKLDGVLIAAPHGAPFELGKQARNRHTYIYLDVAPHTLPPLYVFPC